MIGIKTALELLLINFSYNCVPFSYDSSYIRYVWNFIDETIGRVVKQLAKRGVKFSALYTAMSSKAVSVHHAMSDYAVKGTVLCMYI